MIFFLHGVSSSGKSSIAQELRELFARPLISVGIDWLYALLPDKFIGMEESARLGCFYRTVSEVPQKLISARVSEGIIEHNSHAQSHHTNIGATEVIPYEIVFGPAGQKVHDLTIPLMTVVIGTGLDIVIDEILYAGEGRAEFLIPYAELLAPREAYFIKVSASLEVLEARERKRDRIIGTARAQLESVHAHGYEYDFEVSTDTATARESAEQILAFVAQHEPRAFRMIAQRQLRG